MRTLDDDEGRTWDVMVGRASWGAFCLLFVPRSGEPARQAHLDATSASEAERILAGLAPETLEARFRASSPRDP